jgi:hypothetical protein
MVKATGNALGGLDDLPDDEREMLFETFRVWQGNDASMRGAAEVLICHPNTVRHRLRRIEKLTGRALSRPRDVAELCLAFEVRRRLIEPRGWLLDRHRCRSIAASDDDAPYRGRCQNGCGAIGDRATAVPRIHWSAMKVFCLATHTLEKS